MGISHWWRAALGSGVLLSSVVSNAQSPVYLKRSINPAPSLPAHVVSQTPPPADSVPIGTTWSAEMPLRPGEVLVSRTIVSSSSASPTPMAAQASKVRIQAPLPEHIHELVEALKERLRMPNVSSVLPVAAVATPQIEPHLHQLRAEARQLVQAEAARLNSEVDHQIAKLRQEAQAAMANEDLRLNAAVKYDVKVEVTTQLADAVAKLDHKLAEQLRAMKVVRPEDLERAIAETKLQLSAQIAKLPEGFQSQASQLKEEMLRELSATLPKPESPPTLKAVQPISVKPVITQNKLAPAAFDENAPPPPE